jgi:hypothetical protein
MMSVLAEAISVVVCRAAIDHSYMGGMAAFERDAPSGTFCSDGLLARAGFYTVEQAEYFVAVLRACGLRSDASGVAADCVVVDRNLGPMKTCLWVEFGYNRAGIALCWHTAGRRGNLCAPAGWTPPSKPIGDAPGQAFGRQVRLVQRDHRMEWFRERGSGRLLAIPPFTPESTVTGH